MTERYTLAQQIDAVELVVLSRRAHIARCEANGGKDKHPSLGVDRAWLPILESALSTLRCVAAHEAAVKAAIRGS